VQGEPGLTGAEGPQGPKGDVGEPGPAGSGGTGHVYRWNTVVHATATGGFPLEPELLGGVNGPTWQDGMRARYFSADKEVLRTFFTRKGYPGKNALVFGEQRTMLAAQFDRLWAAVLFRVTNSTADPIVWPLTWRFSANGSAAKFASCAFNGAEVFLSTQTAPNLIGSFQVLVPAQSTGTLICLAPPGPGASAQFAATAYTQLAFVGNSLLMPAGLSLVDDLELASGGWER